MFYQRLKIIRAASGLSLRELSTKIDNLVTAQAISNYERGESTPDSSVLMALADALGVSASYLLSHHEIALGGVEFRKMRLRSRRRQARVEAAVMHLLDRYLSVEELLCLPSVTWDKPRQAPWPIEEDSAEAEQAADSLRRYWGLGLDPIPNLAELLESRGVKTLSTDLKNVGALAAHAQRKQGAAATVFVVNQAWPGERQRFAMARELGHLVMAVAPGVSSRISARRFAGAFLMPAETLRSEIGAHRKHVSWGELLALKRIFGVSLYALIYRCRDLHVFGRTMYRRFLDELSAQGWRNPPYAEPGGLAGEKSSRLERLTYRALAEDAISSSKAAELLDTSIREVDRRTYQPFQTIDKAAP